MFIHTGMFRPLELFVQPLYGFVGSSKQYMSPESCGMTVSFELHKLFFVRACFFHTGMFRPLEFPYILCMALLGPQNSI